MKRWIALLTLASLTVLSGCTEGDEAPANEATELRDWARSNTSRAELTTQIAELKMRLRLLEQASPNSAELTEAKAQLAKLEQSLKDLNQP